MKSILSHFKGIALLLFSSILFNNPGYAQVKDSIPPTKKDSTKLVFSGYVDTYYAYYTDSVGVGKYQQFPSVSPRSNSIGLNIAMFKAQYTTEKIRGAAALQYGDIPLAMWSPKYNFIQEANVGIRLHKKLWLDGGFFRAHIGAEGLFPKENITSSIAIRNYMSPFYEAGFKLSYDPSEKLELNLFILNGYNTFEDNNDKKSTGILIKYSFTDHFNVGYSNYFGDDSPNNDTIGPVRLYNNVFLNLETKKIKLQFDGDYAIQKTDDPNDPASVMSGLLSIRYQLPKKVGIYLRGEYFSDIHGFLSGTYLDENNTITGLSIFGFTAGLEFKPSQNSFLRIEGRQLNAEKTRIYNWNSKSTNIRNELTINMGVSF